MILIYYMNETFVTFDHSVWLTLRSNYRIVGSLVGCLPSIPRQNIFQGLPMVFLPEQTLLLVEKNIAQLVFWSNLTSPPTDEQRIQFEEEVVIFKNEQNASYKKKRIEWVQNNLDKIVAGKQKRMQPNQCADRDEILKTELDNIKDKPVEIITLPLRLTPQQFLTANLTNVSMEVIKNKTNNIRCLVFKDLWEKGFYVTEALNFGGDFLVYLGDPIEYHASYIVKCIDDFEYKLKVTDFIALGRLSNSVKKKMLLAYVRGISDTVVYRTLKWDYD